MRSPDEVKLTFELLVHKDLARTLYGMANRMEGGLDKVMLYALAFYVSIDENLWPNDTFWIKRGNDMVQLRGLKLPTPVGEKAAVDAKKPKQKKLVIPENWQVHDGGKE